MIEKDQIITTETRIVDPQYWTSKHSISETVSPTM